MVKALERGNICKAKEDGVGRRVNTPEMFSEAPICVSMRKEGSLCQFLPIQRQIIVVRIEIMTSVLAARNKPTAKQTQLTGRRTGYVHSASQEKMEGLVKIFVYGTLKRGFANHYLLENNFDGAASFITKGHTKEAFPLVVGTDAYIPFMLPLKGQGKQVYGEIYEVNRNVLSLLDDLEDHPTWYKRSPCEVIVTNEAAGFEGGDTVSCSSYFLTNFTQKFLSLEFLSEYTLEHHLKTYSETSSRNKYCDFKGQSQDK